jgi:hypothetical protein
MADRVLNFSEFQTKYSQESEQDSAAALSNLSTAADSFSTGFDDSTYDEAPLGPKRPIASGETTPVQPGDTGAPKFDSNATSGMEFPDEKEEEELDEPVEGEDDEINPTYGAYDYEDVGNPEDEDEDDEDEDDEDEEGEDEDEDEDGEANESRSWYRSRGLVESFDAFSTRGGQPKEYDKISDEIELIDFSDQDDEDALMLDDNDQLHMTGHSYDDDCYAYCKACGSKKTLEPGDKPYGTMNKMDSDSWWQGTELGMQCGCNM